MSDADRSRWNARYDADEYGARTHPCALLEELLPLWSPIAEDSPALDLACGAGRNAVFLAGKGYVVDALDISASALARSAQRASDLGVEVNWVEQDLDDFDALQSLPHAQTGYALIIVVRYADLDLVRRLPALLKPGGRLLVEAHLGGALFDRTLDERGEPMVGGPTSERFRLMPGALAEACASLRVLHDREAQIADPDGRLMALAQFVGQREF